MSEIDSARARILGELIQSARMRSGRRLDDCALVLGVSSEEFAAIETGEKQLSLPDLEALAMYLKVPMSYFWGNTTPMKEQQTDFAGYIALRGMIIGALLRQARIQANRTLEDVAEEVQVSTVRLEAYESGAGQIPFFELERLATYLEVPMQYFSHEEHGPLAQHEAEQARQRRFDEMPPEIKNFVTEPINQSYLETAMRLSEMDVDRLRNIAESILEITL